MFTRATKQPRIGKTLRPDEITNDTDRVEDINDYDSTIDEVGVSDISGVEVADIDNEREARENENVDFRVSKDPE